jgi:hypothetical protein
LLRKRFPGRVVSRAAFSQFVDGPATLISHA